MGKCYICGTEFDINEDICPHCNWWYLGYEDELDKNEVEPFNTISIIQAQTNYKKGLTVFGEPIKK